MRGSFFVVVVVGALAFTASADAQRRQRVRQADVEEALASSDRAEIQQGIENVGLSGNARFVPLLAERIKQGLPPDLLALAVDTLGVLAKPEAGEVLFMLATHRRPEIRQKAVEAIVACGPEGSDAVLIAALEDQSPDVRAAAAMGLGEIGAQTGTRALFHALDKNVLEASAALGQLVRPAEVERVLGYVGQLPFDVITPALTELIARDDMPEEKKLEVIGHIAELATPEAGAFLQHLAESLPDNRRMRSVREAATSAAERITQ
jgi:HEAT repeat protein